MTTRGRAAAGQALALSHRWPELHEGIEARAEGLVALRRDLHRHPELAFGERRTASLVAERLHRAGLVVATGVARTGVVAVLHGDAPGRTVAWRAEMDALPLQEQVDAPFKSIHDGVMHACGHDGHTAIAVTLAELLASQRRSWRGTLVFIFQPAEETLAGARAMLESAVLERHAVEELYGLHLTTRVSPGRLEASRGVTMAAADLLEIAVSGRAAHGATPHLAIDPIAVAAHILLGLPQVVTSTVAARRAAVLTVGQVVGGEAPNAIPDQVVMRGSLRTLNARDRQVLLRRIERYVKHVATAHRAHANLRMIGEHCPTLSNDVAKAALVRACAAAELGKDSVRRAHPVFASDDMSLFLAQRPGCYFRVGAGRRDRPPTPHHSPIFEIDEASLSIGIRVASSVLLHALEP